MKLAEWPLRRIALLWIGVVVLYGALAIHGRLQDQQSQREWEGKYGAGAAVPIDSLPLSQAQRDSARALGDSAVSLMLGSIAKGLAHAPPAMWWWIAGMLSLFALPGLLVVGVTVAWAILRHRARRTALTPGA